MDVHQGEETPETERTSTAPEEAVPLNQTHRQSRSREDHHITGLCLQLVDPAPLETLHPLHLQPSSRQKSELRICLMKSSCSTKDPQPHPILRKAAQQLLVCCRIVPQRRPATGQPEESPRCSTVMDNRKAA
ncbi:Uncharacterized protein DAT39_004987 [Clarias magur]|uniref:Uncharacterized protein n=1 Tax=Clarias magur TaxID=1594786 RepID=A0A8J4U5T4_CLAMG|nr:Uncharacterized protein DAT39_004987 [Clarias magur]